MPYKEYDPQKSVWLSASSLQAGNARDSLLPSEGVGAKGPANVEPGRSQPRESAGFQHTMLTETPLSEKWIWKKSFFDSLGCS